MNFSFCLHDWSVRQQSEQLRQRPDQKQSRDRAEESEETGGAVASPLPMLGKRPLQLEDQRPVTRIFNWLPGFMKLTDARHEFLCTPLWVSFNSSQLPFPQGSLARKTTECYRHLERLENADDRKGQDQ